MADVVDVANDFIDLEVARALKARQVLPQKIGAKECKNCGEDMLQDRRKLGFDLCVECAEETERRNALFAKY